MEKLLTFKCVTYLGALNKNSLLDAYRQSDVFIMLSHRETFGLVYAEAMSQGLPVIYTKNQGFDGQFDEGLIGFHSSPNKIEEIENIIIKVSENHKLLSFNASKYVRKFNWKVIAKRYDLIYSELLN